MTLKWRLLFWVGSWIDLACSLIEILTFMYWVPAWDSEYKWWLINQEGM